MEESGSAFPRDEGGKENRKGKERKKNVGDTRARIISRHHAGEDRKVGEIKQVVSFYAANGA